MIRLATAADLDAVVDLHAEARATYYRGHLPEADYRGPEEVARARESWAAAVGRGAVLCAVRDGEIVGVAAHGERDGLAHLTQLHVRPAHWRSGVGTALHEACVRIWRTAGTPAVRLEVFDRNERAQAFYAAHGWTPDPDHPRDGDHLVLRLTPGGEAEAE
ncbi:MULTISPECIES: GNAT family N-acetyltransferase [unclassified Streptomyces]|uniref:GNAT family N-acetyltransferase n=1 Tax=unclassified Streptomyces TaxID=2593676 RepID=UPI00166074DE|nr:MULTISPECIES: GNAT family N-acetyltransferase [unclassified Streptomyces]MBD0709255.1 GNAT family N-acetyltransferase [Streptomyces sp. CBMA291]MBD0713586.1 GNAT family N-acetyltransferase [Streptomyces sp. CBMA370]